jgi:hypothetical protein
MRRKRAYSGYCNSGMEIASFAACSSVRFVIGRVAVAVLQKEAPAIVNVARVIASVRMIL